ncbi:MAG: DUF4013 domain-containing protein [Candidatus Methanodesulfokora sp.]|nr:MAG: hypothetical protein C0200_06030 [Candidatus Korarchaeota archaeon]
MNLSDNLNKAGSFTGKVFSDIGNLILLIVLNIIPIVNFIVLGYMAKIVRESPDEPPKLGDYGKLFVDGLLVLIALIIYAIIPSILLIAGVFMAGLGPFGISRFASPLALLAGGGLFIAGLILLFIFMIFGVMAIGNMIRSGMNFSKIFAFSENWELIKKVGLGNYLIWYIVIFIVALILGAIGSVIPWVGGAIAGVFVYLFVGKSLALLLDEVIGLPKLA